MTEENSQSSVADDIGKRSVTITYLEQRARPVYPPAPHPPQKLALLRAENPPIHFYRYLYRLVGDPWNWVSRRRMSDRELGEILNNPDVYIYVLYVDGVPGGFAEIDRTNPQIHEIKFFGLTPDFTGRNLGRYFLTNMIDIAWSMDPECVRLETCTLDHPAALPLYQKLGFSVYDQRQGVVELMEKPATPH